MPRKQVIDGMHQAQMLYHWCAGMQSSLMHMLVWGLQSENEIIMCQQYPAHVYTALGKVRVYCPLVGEPAFHIVLDCVCAANVVDALGVDAGI